MRYNEIYNTSIRVSKETQSQLKEIAKKKGLILAYLTDDILKEYIAKNK